MRASVSNLTGTLSGVAISDESWAAIEAEAKAVDAEFAAAGIAQTPEQQYEGDHAGETLDGQAVQFRLQPSRRTESRRDAEHAEALARSLTLPRAVLRPRRGCARPRARRASAPRRRGSRRTSGSRAGPDGDSGDSDSDGEHLAPADRGDQGGQR